MQMLKICTLIATLFLIGSCAEHESTGPLDGSAAADQLADVNSADLQLADASSADLQLDQSSDGPLLSDAPLDLPAETAPDSTAGDTTPADSTPADSTPADAAPADSAAADITPSPDSCVPNCTAKECGTNGCGGSCGTCAYGCVTNLCRRKLTVVRIYIACDLCGDTLIQTKPDPYITLKLSTGVTYGTSYKKDACNTLTYNWSIPNLDALHLKTAKFSIIDKDTDADDLCVSWTGDFSKVGTRTLVGSKNSKLIYTVSK